MDDSTDEPTAHSDQECVAHLGQHLRRALLALALITAPLALLWAGLFTGPSWAGPLWICQGLGLALLVATCYRMLLGPVGQRLNAPAHPRVPPSPEVLAHQRRMNSGHDQDPR
ncbi:hypothetical protein YW3DRAFT_07391 [Streptomyces sp. MnatMP-M77]|uniref:hypothetical protein n=1 Tax=unclassified Streptomyces TaxID=2593676 RepID=UPI0008051F6D|nr:hypothetical protein [Streptomyces sp. MnatMP-M77]MYT81267.1 hypothetical protein [Streptomyces sp. SID8364]SBV06273.1 hypothetical protein YW3DRAFT_07391 [Streptomyces sp. MnatMP-M77]